MSLETSVWLVVLVSLLGANWPFASQRFLVFFSPKQPKSLGVRLLELVLFYFLVGVFSLSLEQSVGQIYPQHWEFYATTGALFLTLAFPGFVFRYLRKT